MLHTSRMTPPIKEPDLALAGLALLVIFGLVIWHDRQIESSRPFDPYVQPKDRHHTTGYAYESWLWEDPFALEKPDSEKKGDIDHKEGQCKYQLNNALSHKNAVKVLAPVLKVWPNTLENKELRTRHRYAVIAGLIESGYRPSGSDHLHFCSIQNNRTGPTRLNSGLSF